MTEESELNFPWLKVQCLAGTEIHGYAVFCEEPLYIGAKHCEDCGAYKKWKEINSPVV